MNILLFRYLLAFCLLAMPMALEAQAPDSLSIDSLVTEPQDTLVQRLSRYQRKLERYHRRWNALIPRQGFLQYAGNMGAVSLGVGWDYGRHKQWETVWMFGFLPKCGSAGAKGTMTVKENYIPFHTDLGKDWQLEPLTASLYLNTIFGRTFWSSLPSRYPRGYYKMSTRVRANIALGQRITKWIDEESFLGVRGLTFFYEITTCDLYLVTKIKNSTLPWHDILSLSLGIKLQFI